MVRTIPVCVRHVDSWVHVARHAPAADIETFGQPQPIVLDTRLDMPLDCKLITNYRTGVSNKQPWVVTSKAADASKLVSSKRQRKEDDDD